MNMSKGVCMVVEDNHDLLELMDFYLKSEGYTVALAEDGKKAVELLGQLKPHVIITDLMMPGMSGAELIAHVRHSAKLKQVPIIVVTAASADEGRRAKQEGANEVLRKPLDFDKLLKLINGFAA